MNRNPRGFLEMHEHKPVVGAQAPWGRLQSGKPKLFPGGSRGFIKKVRNHRGDPITFSSFVGLKLIPFRLHQSLRLNGCCLSLRLW